MKEGSEERWIKKELKNRMKVREGGRKRYKERDRRERFEVRDEEDEGRR